MTRYGLLHRLFTKWPRRDNINLNLLVFSGLLFFVRPQLVHFL